MAKFKVLKVNQTYMSWLGLYSYSLTEPTNEFFKSIGSYYNLISMVALFVTSCVFIYKNYSTDITAAMNAIKVCVSTVQWVGIFIGLGLNMIKIKSLHCELQQVVDEGISVSFFIIFVLDWYQLTTSIHFSFINYNMMKTTTKWTIFTGIVSKNAEKLPNDRVTTCCFIHHHSLLFWFMRLFAWLLGNMILRPGIYHSMWLCHLIRHAYRDGYWRGFFSFLLHFLIQHPWHRLHHTL